MYYYVILFDVNIRTTIRQQTVIQLTGNLVIHISLDKQCNFDIFTDEFITCNKVKSFISLA